MKNFLMLFAVVGLAGALSACKAEPVENNAPAGAAVEQAAPEAAPAPEAASPAEEPSAEAAPATAAGSEPVKEEGKEAEEAPEDPDEDSPWNDGKAAAADREKLAKAYQEVYCAQKKGEMDKLLDIYKANGFEKPEDFISTWVEVARDTAWVTKVATDAAARCK